MTYRWRDATLIAAASFEERALAGAHRFIEAGGEASRIALIEFISMGSEEMRLTPWNDLGVDSSVQLDRTSSSAVWKWIWSKIDALEGEVIIDVTCIPREVLAMMLFALSLRSARVDGVYVYYTAPGKYVTQCEELDESERWLSRGVRRVRSILGFPGKFAVHRDRHVVVLMGHELDRTLEMIAYLEPSRLTIGREVGGSSVVAGASELSEELGARLRETAGLREREYGECDFSPNSISSTFHSLMGYLKDSQDENVALIAMNTKLSFVGAALCSLRLRHIRMMYAVPVEYNPLYTSGVGEVKEFDISDGLGVGAG